MLAESQRLETEISSIESVLRTLPKGHLICTKNRKYFKWYQSDGRQQSYIPKGNRQLAELLAYKEYSQIHLEECQRKKKVIDKYLEYHLSYSNKIEEFLTTNSEIRQLVSPYFQPLSKELAEWAKAPYEQNTKYPENLIHKSISGNMVRSKSEALIDMMLYLNQIPFRYESALQLNSVTFYPDFTIRHPKTGQAYYWEHFGLMDNPAYSQNVASKLQIYISEGIIPSIQLIMTFETLEQPLSSDMISAVLQNYFL